jgi:hypothetical protein
MHEEKTWKARWIADERFVALRSRNLLHKENDNMSKREPHLPELKNVHMLIRKGFRIDDPQAPAHIDITADDYYKLYINGKFVGQGPAQGYHFHYFYNRFDIQPYLHEGDNVIAVHVHYQGLINRAMNSADYRQGMIAELFSNDRLVAATDASWKYRLTLEYGSNEAEAIGYETQFAEHIDHRRKETRWRETDYDDRDWLPASEGKAMDYSFHLQPTPPLEVYRMAPVKVEALPGGNLIVDFGQEMTGQLSLIAQGQPGQRLELRFGEELLEDAPGVRYKMRCSTTYCERWTLSGEEDEMEGYDYKGFRFVEIVGGQGAVKAENISAIARHYPYPASASSFHTEDALLQGIWDICRNGVKYGSQEHYVDCPTREKGQYLGDNSITAPAHALLTGDLRLYRKALSDFARSTRICPGMMAVAPGHFMQEFVDYSLQWPTQLLQYYLYSGDKIFLREMLPYAAGIVEHFRQYSREDGLLGTVRDKPHLVDWPRNMRDGYDFPLTWPVTEGSHNVANALYYGAMHAVNRIREELDEPERYELEAFRMAFEQAFGRSGNGAFRDAETTSHTSLHANAIPLYVGLVPDKMREGVVRLLKEKGMRCGVYMSYFYLKGLASAGEHDYVYRTMVSQERRVEKAADKQMPAHVELTGYWANMLREGATACYEAWSKRLKWNTSLCHPWASAPIPLLIEDLLGITPAEPGWKSIRFRPRIPAEMPDLTLQLALPTAKVSVEVRNGVAEISVPQGVQVV